MTCENDEKWMRRCIQIAQNGAAGAPPNPMVGAVAVYEDRILGEGYHIRCGGPHAEVNALAAVAEADRPLLRRCTLYVSLEPCAHYGKTPPCAERIIREGIPRVVVGCVDPFARVSGKGIAMMREAGIEVRTGVCEAACLALNRRFFTFHTLHRPYILLKWACSADGYLDLERTDGQPVVFSTPHTLLDVHRLRADYEAIVVGGRTAVLDNPSLTARHWPARRNPLRIVLDDRGTLPDGLRLWNESAPTWVVCSRTAAEGYARRLPGSVQYVEAEGAEALPVLMERLHAAGVQSLIVEGGAQTLRRFLDAGLWDEARVERSSLTLGSGVAAPSLPVGSVARAERHWSGATIVRYVRPGAIGDDVFV